MSLLRKGSHCLFPCPVPVVRSCHGCAGSRALRDSYVLGRYDIMFAGDYNCFPDERLADWFPRPESRPETVMR